MLGLEGSERGDPSPDEVKRAFRQQVVRWHPDSPGGDATRFQEVRDAYELLLKRRPSRSSIDSGIQPNADARVWQEGRLWQEGVSSSDGSGNGGAPGGAGQQGITSLLPAVFAVAVLGLVGLGFAALGPKDPPRETLQGPGSVKVVRQKAVPLRGMEYTAMAAVAGKRAGTELLLLGDAAVPSDAGPAARATRLSKDLLAALNEPAAAGDSGKAKYGSITAVVSDLDFNRILKIIRNDEGDEQIVESRYPYLLFSGGRPVARFEKEATQQELLIVAALDYRRATPDQIDAAFMKTMAAEHAPDLLALDLSEAAWRDIAGEFSQATGAEPWRGLRPRGPVSSPEPTTPVS